MIKSALEARGPEDHEAPKTEFTPS